MNLEEKIEEEQRAVDRLKGLFNRIESKPRIIISSDREDYIILGRDFARGTSKERSFVKKYRNILFGLYNNQCAVCKATNSLDLDHFGIPKYEGGCFVMHHRNGMKVCNAVPLCEKCNRSKGKKPPDYSDEVLGGILEKMMYISVMLNQEDKGTG